ncbi:MAG: flavodoxin [Sutterellaceae bacterium]|nr:flavodoxin [Sutterellaceae bacterium]
MFEKYISKRTALKTMAAAGVSMALGLSGAKGAEMMHPKILTVYFTWGGASGEAAQIIHKFVGGDIVRIQTQMTLPEDYEEMVKIHKAWSAAQEHPAIQPLGVNVADYDVIILGHGIWSGKLPMPVRSFLDKVDFKGKKFLHFACHGGSGLGQSQNELGNMFPEADLMPGLPLYGWGGLRDADKIEPWLVRMGLLPKK